LGRVEARRSGGASLPYSGAQTAFFSFEMTIESFRRGTRGFEWLEDVPRECAYDNLRSVVARRERDEVDWNPRFLHLAFNLPREGSKSQSPTHEGVGPSTALDATPPGKEQAGPPAWPPGVPAHSGVAETVTLRPISGRLRPTALG
jgi:hypothetical protein